MLHFRKMEYISLLASFRAHASEGLYYDEDPHWTPRGQDLAAQIVADHLRRSSSAAHPPRTVEEYIELGRRGLPPGGG